MKDSAAWIESHAGELVATYEQLHRIPEIGFQEYKTSAFLARALGEAGFSVQEGIGGTGVLGILRGAGAGPGFALRADMDALPLEERTGLAYSSTHPGRGHLCGHDGHCAMVLYAARAMAATGGIRRGVLHVLFQPAEEGPAPGGARAVIDSGVLRGVEEMVGIHLRPERELPTGEASPAVCHGASCAATVRISGRAAHAAWPQLGVNALDAVAAVINAVNATRADARVPHSVKATRCVAGGQAHNVIPDAAELTLDLRAQDNAVMDELRAALEKAIAAAAGANGSVAEVAFSQSYPAASFDAELVAEAAAAIERVCGRIRPAIQTPGGEDFHRYSREAGIRTAYIGLGGNMGTGLHTPAMVVDTGVLPRGAIILAALAGGRLGYPV